MGVEEKEIDESGPNTTLEEDQHRQRKRFLPVLFLWLLGVNKASRGSLGLNELTLLDVMLLVAVLKKIQPHNCKKKNMIIKRKPSTLFQKNISLSSSCKDLIQMCF